jgi:predicted dithiol-disulfide oxidoreductase (DUF899 family)
MSEQKIRDFEKKIQLLKKELGMLYKSAEPKPISDYTFQRQDGSNVTLSDLFDGRDELLLIFNMGKECPYCTLWADGYNGLSDHLENRAGFVVVSPDLPKIQKEFYDSRHWRFPMVSHYENSFAENFGFKVDGEYYLPGVATFSKDDSGQIFFHVSSQFGPGDNFCSQWDFLRMLPNGENKWVPKYTYEKNTH